MAGMAQVKFPIMLATSLNDIESILRAASHMLFTAEAFAVGRAKDSLHESTISPRYSNFWVGVETVFS